MKPFRQIDCSCQTGINETKQHEFAIFESFKFSQFKYFQGAVVKGQVKSVKKPRGGCSIYCIRKHSTPSGSCFISVITVSMYKNKPAHDDFSCTVTFDFLINPDTRYSSI